MSDAPYVDAAAWDAWVDFATEWLNANGEQVRAVLRALKRPRSCDATDHSAHL